jgi:1,4-alpha-glucan branching enzyme
VEFVLVAPAAARVSVVGDFNNWSFEATPLRRTGSGGEWRASVPLPPGLYSYAFWVDGNLESQPGDTPRTPADEFGSPSSVLVVEDART